MQAWVSPSRLGIFSCPMDYLLGFQGTPKPNEPPSEGALGEVGGRDPSGIWAPSPGAQLLPLVKAGPP